MINENLLEIIKADKEARNLILKATVSDENERRRAEGVRDELEKLYEKKTKDKISASASQYEEKLEKARASLESKKKEAEKDINELYASKKKEWVRQIFESIVTVEK